LGDKKVVGVFVRFRAPLHKPLYVYGKNHDDIHEPTGYARLPKGL
jgi:hypothetical protein